MIFRRGFRPLVVSGAGFALGFTSLVLPGLTQRLLSRTPQADSARAAPVNEASPEAARALEAKIQILSNSDPRPPAGFEPIIITDLEANSYLKYDGKGFLPPGVNEPEVHIHPDRISATAEVDFGKFNQNAPKSDGWGTGILPLVLSGKQRVSAKGRLNTENGKGKVTIEDVQLGTVGIPDWLVSTVLENYVQKQYNIDLSKPLVLPDHVTRIELGAGRATFYRSPNKNF